MIPATGFQGKKVAVFGLGGSGRVAARALLAGGAEVLAWDDTQSSRDAATEANIPLRDLYTADWSDVSALILAPGVPLTHPEPHPLVLKAQAAEAEVIGDVELFQRALAASGTTAKLVAITGTNGKSTTTALITHMVRVCQPAGHPPVQMGGNIGRAVLDLDPPRDNQVYVVETSSYQIDLSPSLAPDIGVLLNITPDHLDRHGTLEGYAAVKERLFAHQGEGATAVIGQDDELCARIGERAGARPGVSFVPISSGRKLVHGVYAADGRLYEGSGGLRRDAGTLEGMRTLAGAHNAQNAAAAYAVGRALGFRPRDILEAFASFPGLAHRMEIVGEEAGILFVNDSKATNADAASKALATYDNIYWILGGKAKAGGIESLAPYFTKVRRAYLIGDAAEEFTDTLAGKVETRHSGTLDVATEAAREDALAETGAGGQAVVLLSPACASFDQFANFELRGDAFRQTVEALWKEPGGPLCA